MIHKCSKESSVNKLVMYIIISFVLLMVLLVCVVRFKTKTTKSNNEHRTSSIVYLTVEDYDRMITGNESFIVYIGRSTCPYCEVFEPLLFKTLENVKTRIYYLSVQSFKDQLESCETDSQREIVKAEYNKFKEKYDFEYVPNLKVFKDGNEVDRYTDIIDDDYFSSNCTIEEREMIKTDAYNRLLTWVKKNTNR